MEHCGWQEQRYAEAERGKFRGLVVHEGDERGDDEGRAASGERGELVAEGFARAGGHDEQDVAAIGCCFADLLLVGAEVAVAEDAVEQSGEGFGLGGDSGHGLRLVSHIVCLWEIVCIRCGHRVSSSLINASEVSSSSSEAASPI